MIRPMLVAALLTLLAVFVGLEASAHSWYPPKCCSGQDCAPVAPDGISCTAEGCTVTIVPGTHPMVPAGTNGGNPVVLQTTKQPEISPDGQNHACVSRSLRVICVYMGGSV